MKKKSSTNPARQPATTREPGLKPASKSKKPKPAKVPRKKSAIDLKKLSKEEKLELLTILEQRNKAEKAAGKAYDPHEGQKGVHTSKVLERYLFCGNGFGKTAILANEIHWAATGWNPIKKEYTPVPSKMCLIIDTSDKIDEFIIEYRKWNVLTEKQTEKRGKPYYSAFVYPNGSILKVFSHEVKELKPEGAEWTHIFADEPPPFHIFKAVFRGGRIKGRPLRILLAGTPITAAWLRKEIFEPWKMGETPWIECFKGTSDENADNLDPSWFERFFGKLSEHEQKIRRQGEFFDLEGQALRHLWHRETHIISLDEFDSVWDENNPCVLSIDPHPEKAHVASILGADKFDYLYYIKEVAKKLPPRDFAKFIKKWWGGYRIVDIVVDNYGSQEMTGGEGFDTFIQVLRDEGVMARPTTYKEKKDDLFIDRIQDSLLIPPKKDNMGMAVPKLRVVEGNIGIIDDIEQVSWQRNRKLDENKAKLEISNRDFLATLKYALATNISAQKGKARVYRMKKMPTSYGIRPPQHTVGYWRKKLLGVKK